MLTIDLFAGLLLLQEDWTSDRENVGSTKNGKSTGSYNRKSISY